MKKVLFVLAIAACTVACGKKEGKCCEGEQGCQEPQEVVVEENDQEEATDEAEPVEVEVTEETPAEN